MRLFSSKDGSWRTCQRRERQYPPVQCMYQRDQCSWCLSDRCENHAALGNSGRCQSQAHLVLSNVGRVAIVQNKLLMNISGMKSHELVPGRAILTFIPWLKETSLKVLAVYARNEPQTNQYFWESIQSRMRSLLRPDIMLGDFNVVEDALDRLPTPRQTHLAPHRHSSTSKPTPNSKAVGVRRTQIPSYTPIHSLHAWAAINTVLTQFM